MPSSVLQTTGAQIVEPAAGLCSQPDLETHQCKWLFLILAVTFCYLYISLFSLSGIPYFGNLRQVSDQAAFWTYACRMLSGQVFLRDFHQFTPPGTDLIYAAVFHWFGASMCSINWTILWLGIVLVIVCYYLARSVLRPGMAALAALLCLVVLYGDRLDATHHWFSSLANLLAVLILSSRRNWPSIAAAGTFIAFAAFCTQTSGAVGLLACCAGLAWEWRNSQISSRLLLSRSMLLFGAAFVVWLPISWRFIAQAGPAKYWYEQVIYPPKDGNFPTGFLIPHFTWSAHPRPAVALFDHLTTYLLLLLVCPWVTILCARRRSGTNQSSVALFLLASLGVFQALEVVTMLNWNRMAAAAIPSMILAAWLISRMGPAKRAAVAACWCIVAAIILVEPLAMRMHTYTRADLPTGMALLRKDDAGEVLWLAQHTHRGDWFFEAANTRLYVPLALKNPTSVHLLMALDSTLPSWVTEVVQGLDQSRTRYILWSPHSGIGAVERMHALPGDQLDPLRSYMQRTYMRVAVFANGDEVWERNN